MLAFGLSGPGFAVGLPPGAGAIRRGGDVCRPGLRPERRPQTAVWDGSVAGSFAGGDGSEADPFRIETGSQLAFLAREVNGGKDYAGKYVSMVCDVDLNHVEWTPIGNGTHSFSGIFHGNGHTVSNLKMTDGARFAGELSSAETDQYAAGLFGTARNAVIRNVKINHADIVVQNLAAGQFVTVGILVGDLRADTYAEISGVSVADASIRNDFPETKGSCVSAAFAVMYAGRMTPSFRTRKCRRM